MWIGVRSSGFGVTGSFEVLESGTFQLKVNMDIRNSAKSQIYFKSTLT
jgi:hypothetical protein